MSVKDRISEGVECPRAGMCHPREPEGHSLDMTSDLAVSPTVKQLLPQLKAAGYKCIEDKDFANALLAFKKIVELDGSDVNARFVYAQLIDNGSHKTRAEARDLMLSILDEYPEILNQP